VDRHGVIMTRKKTIDQGDNCFMLSKSVSNLFSLRYALNTLTATSVALCLFSDFNTGNSDMFLSFSSVFDVCPLLFARRPLHCRLNCTSTNRCFPITIFRKLYSLKNVVNGVYWSRVYQLTNRRWLIYHL